MSGGLRSLNFIDTFQKRISTNDIRRLIFMALVFGSLSSLGILAVDNLPPTYRVNVRFEFNESEHLGMAVENDKTGVSEERAKLLFLRATTREKLEEYLNDSQWGTTGSLLEEAVDEVKRGVSIKMLQSVVATTAWRSEVLETIGFTLNIDTTNPSLSAFIGAKLAETMLIENERTRIREASETVSAIISREQEISDLIAKIKLELTKIETNDYNAVPQHTQQARHRLQGLTKRAELSAYQLSVKSRSLEEVERVIALFPSKGAGQEQLNYLTSLLNDYKVSLMSLSETAAPEHPDLEIFRTNIEELENYLGQIQEGDEKSLAPNQFYLDKLLKKRDLLISQIAKLELLVFEIEKEIDVLQSGLKSASSQEGQRYRDLVLELNVVESEFRKLRKLRYRAEYTLSLEEAGKIGRFSLATSISAPWKAVYPNKLAWYVLILYSAGVISWIVGKRKPTSHEKIHTSSELKLIVGNGGVYLIPRIF